VAVNPILVDMVHPTPYVNAELQLRLGDAPLERILRYLQPVDCQMCGKPFGERRPSLVVVQLGPEAAVALLVHTRCSPPAWLVDGIDWTDPEQPLGSWRAGAAAVAVESSTGSQGPDRIPAVVVNPGLDSVHLSRNEGVWWPDLSTAAWPFESMADLCDEPVGTRRIRGARLRVEDATVFVDLEDGSERWWTGADDEFFWAQMEVRGGALLVLSYSLDPHAMTIENLTAMRRPGEAIAGWVSATPNANARQAARSKSRRCRPR
jgi:hypothetical protein